MYSDRLTELDDEAPPQNAKHQDVVLWNTEALTQELAARMVGSRERTSGRVEVEPGVTWVRTPWVC